MASVFTLGVIVRVIDKFSAPFRSFRKMLGEHRDQLNQLGQEMKSYGKTALVAGALIGGALAAPTVAFAQLEDASTRLKVTLMDSRGGLPAAFGELEKKAIALGNRLPGTTADFLNMASVLGSRGQSTDTIVGGLLEASALLGVTLKPLGATYQQTAESVAIFGNALGIARDDMVSFTDLIQRAAFLGVSLGDLTYAIARSAPSLKVLGIQGLEASKDLVPLIAMLDRAGIQGELAGTGIRNVLNMLSNPEKIGKVSDVLRRVGIEFNTLDKNGRFIGIRHMIGELSKLQSLNPAQFTAIMEELFGGGGDAEVAKNIITGGLAEYNRITAQMRAQAVLQTRVNEQLGTLVNLWDAATGTFTNTLAEFGRVLAPEIKALTVWITGTSEAMGTWIRNNPKLVKWLGYLAVIAAGVAVALGAIAIAVGAVMTFLAGGTVAAVIAGVVVVFAYLGTVIAALVVWWDDLTAAVVGFWEALKGGFGLFKWFADTYRAIFGGPKVEVPSVDIQAQASDRRRNYAEFLAQQRGQGGAKISIGNLNLPSVRNSQDFIGEMESMVGGMTPASAVP